MMPGFAAGLVIGSSAPPLPPPLLPLSSEDADCLPRSRGAFFLSRGRFIELPAAPPMSAGAMRTLARRTWHGRAPVPAPLQGRAAQLAQETPQLPGRVHPQGRFEDEALWQALSSCLPEDWAAALRRPLEWY